MNNAPMIRRAVRVNQSFKLNDISMEKKYLNVLKARIECLKAEIQFLENIVISVVEENEDRQF